MKCRCGSPEIKDAPGTWYCGTRVSNGGLVHSPECIRAQYDRLTGRITNLAEFRRGVDTAYENYRVGQNADTFVAKIAALLRAFPEAS